ncbi:hypothetical protein Tco_0897422 [Tanacetum coccineum]
MALSIADQIALDDALVAPADRLKIGKCNLRLSSDITSKEATLQVVYDVLKLTPFYKAFQVTADAPEIYMQEFWASAYVHNRSVRFKMNNKKHIIGLEQFRDILQICPKVGNKKFVDPPLETEIIIFLASLGHSGDIRKLSDVNVNKLHQPWRSFAAVINKCLCGTPSYDSLRLSQAQILWGMYNQKNVDYAYLLWEDFIFKIETKSSKKGSAMYYPRFTKLVVNYVMEKDPSIPRRNKVNWHYARDDPMFSTINVISRNEATQLYGAILPVALTNEDIRNSESYKEYYAMASGTIPPKTKGSKKKANTDAIPKPKSSTAPKKKKSGTGKQKTSELENISEADLTEAEQLKIVIKRSRQETHSSHASGSGADEGTGVTPGVPDAPDYDSDDDISWKSSDDDQDDEQDQDDDDAEKHEVHETTQEEEDDDEHDDDENDQEDDDASDDDKKAEDDDDEEMTESDNDGDDFAHPKLTTHEDEIIHEKDTDEDDSSISSSDEDDSDNDIEGAKVAGAKSGEDATDAKEDVGTKVKEQSTQEEPSWEPSFTAHRSIALPNRTFIHSTTTNIPNFTHCNLLQAPRYKIFPKHLPRCLAFDNRTESVRKDQFLRTQAKPINIAEALPPLFLALFGGQLSNNKNAGSSGRCSPIGSYERFEKSQTIQRQLNKGLLLRRMNVIRILLDYIWTDTVSIKDLENDEAVMMKKPPLDTGTGAGKTTSTGSKTHTKSASQSAPVGEATHSTDVFKGPAYQEFETGVQDEQAEEEAQHLPELVYNNLEEYPSPDMQGNKFCSCVAADYGHIKWIEDLVPNSMWSQTIVKYDKIRPLGNLALGQEATTVLCILQPFMVQEGGLHRLRSKDIEAMHASFVQGKVTNLSVEERIAFNVSLSRNVTRNELSFQRRWGRSFNWV